jgi:hypothetical protein
MDGVLVRLRRQSEKRPKQSDGQANASAEASKRDEDKPERMFSVNEQNQQQKNIETVPKQIASNS